MSQEQSPHPNTQEEILQQQYLRALSSFEGIVLSQIDVKNRLGNRLNYSIRAGIIILGAIAISILILLLSLSSQVNRITKVVGEMDTHFEAIATKMDDIREHLDHMDRQVALVREMGGMVAVMDKEMQQINLDMSGMQGKVNGIEQNLARVRQRVDGIAVNIDQLNRELQGITHQMHRLGKPARSLNKMMPFP
jgi:uncharacterized protein YoxC